MTSKIEKSVDVNVPVHVAYNQWTQFEEFPKFMQGVRSVKQLDDKHLQWHAEIAGKDKRWEAEITEQIPDQKIAWCSTSGAPNAGIVTFHPLAEAKCRVMLQLQYNPEDFIEKAGDMVGIVSQRIQGDLERFKEFIESRGEATGAWRGEIRRTG
ncbi:MAG: cyclase [Nitrospiraceae bacterium]